MSSANSETAHIPQVRLNLTARLLRASAILLVLLVAAVIVSAGLGAVNVPMADVAKTVVNHLPIIGKAVHFRLPEGVDSIVWQFHVPRTLLAALVGLSLAVAGASLQGLLLNPLADPYMIGVSSGAAVGAGIGVILGIQGWMMGFGIPVLAFVFALIAVGIVSGLAMRAGKVSVLSFLLAGVVVGSFMWAVLTFLMTFSSENLETIVFWTMGSFAGSDPWQRVLVILPFTVVGSFVLYAYARDLNLFALGEESARHLGIETESLKRKLIAATALLTAAAVSVSGTIGFVGLMVPHITRRLVGPDHRVLIPCSALLGALMMIAADTVARTVMAPGEIPVGIITALLGAPFFLYLLRRAS